MSGFIAEALTLTGAYQASDPRFKVLVVIAIIGIVICAAFLLWAIQRVFLGTLNQKYKDYPDMTAREIFCMAPLLFLCLLLGCFPHLLLDKMEPTLTNLVQLLSNFQ
jgi:NADH-quinone oxidoreductase subunit M